LPKALYSGLINHGVPAAAAHQAANLPPTSSVFAAFLGYNPIKNLLGPSGVLAHLPHAQAVFLTGRSFFPSLITGPFKHGLHEALTFATICCLLAALAAAMMGKQSFYKAPSPVVTNDVGPTPTLTVNVTTHEAEAQVPASVEDEHVVSQEVKL
jgi:hypothetical protein